MANTTTTTKVRDWPVYAADNEKTMRAFVSVRGTTGLNEAFAYFETPEDALIAGAMMAQVGELELSEAMATIGRTGDDDHWPFLPDVYWYAPDGRFLIVGTIGGG